MSAPALLARAAALVGMASVSHDEAAIADAVAAELSANPALSVTRVADNVVARTTLGRPTRIALAGHLDTVPPAGNAEARLEGERLYGLGSADMKGGLAVMLALAADAGSGPHDLTFVFYACEEVARAHSGLLAIERADADLLVADAAVLLEPTSAEVEAGCQGVLRLEVVLRGRRAHSARPWVGVNAIHRLGQLLDIVGAFPERRPVIDGCEYHETLQAVAVSGGVAGNVVPDEAHLLLSHRFAPDRDADQARQAIAELIAPAMDTAAGDTLEVLDTSPAAPPRLDHPLLGALVAASGAAPKAKIAWTDVAFFAERAIPAVNFGPGDPLLAHTPGEFVDGSELERVAVSLAGLLSER